LSGGGDRVVAGRIGRESVLGDVDSQNLAAKVVYVLRRAAVTAFSGQDEEHPVRTEDQHRLDGAAGANGRRYAQDHVLAGRISGRGRGAGVAPYFDDFAPFEGKFQ
jgi:hypothetical protein